MDVEPMTGSGPPRGAQQEDVDFQPSADAHHSLAIADQRNTVVSSMAYLRWYTDILSLLDIIKNNRLLARVPT